VEFVFPARLVAALQAAGKTKADLAREIGVAPSAVTNWAKGKDVPTGMRLAQIAVALSTSVDFLLGLDLMRTTAPEVGVDLAVAAAGGHPVLWSGRLLSQADRRRTWALLHAMLAPLEELKTPPREDVHRTQANHTRRRAATTQELFASGNAGPRPKRGAGTGGAVGEGTGDGGS